MTPEEINILVQARDILDQKEGAEGFYQQSGWQGVSVALLGLTLTLENGAIQA